METCDNCGRPFDDGGLTDGDIMLCPICATYEDMNSEMEPVDHNMDRRRRRGRHYGGGR